MEVLRHLAGMLAAIGVLLLCTGIGLMLEATAMERPPKGRFDYTEISLLSAGPVLSWTACFLLGFSLGMMW